MIGAIDVGWAAPILLGMVIGGALAIAVIIGWSVLEAGSRDDDAHGRD